MGKQKQKSPSSSVELMALETENKFLKDEVNIIRKDLVKLRKLLEEYDIEDDEISVSDTEMVCLEQIHKLKLLSENTILSKDEVNALDILHKNLRICQGELVPKDKDTKKMKRMSNKDLLKLVN